MENYVSDVQKLKTIIADDSFDPKIRIEAIKALGKVGTNEAMQELLNIIANDKANILDRKEAWKQVGKVLKF
jgi:HEAT repeat protein